MAASRYCVDRSRMSQKSARSELTSGSLDDAELLPLIEQTSDSVAYPGLGRQLQKATVLGSGFGELATLGVNQAQDVVALGISPFAGLISLELGERGDGFVVILHLELRNGPIPAHLGIGRIDAENEIRQLHGALPISCHNHELSQSAIRSEITRIRLQGSF